DWTLTEAPSNCNAPADVTWLAVSSTSGSIPAGDDDRIDVTVDASALADGTYSAVLCLDSNSPSVPRVVIPVTLEAGAPATFEAVTLAVADGGNGVLEAGETAVLATVWSNEGFQDGAA